MADDDIMDFDDDGDFEWYYVEDDFPLVDELAESQIPNPGYAPGYDLELELSDFDLYDYWTDLMYGEDEYWDAGGAGVPTSGEKRKRGAPAAVSSKSISKRRKLTLKDTDGGSVRFISLAARMNRVSRAPVLSGKRKTFALLPDWRQRFAGTTGAVVEKPMPVDMKKAAEADEQPTPPKGMPQIASMMAVEGEDEMDDDDVGVEAELAALDPEALKTVLKQKLGAAGLEGMDEGAFMETIAKMLSGGGGADDAAGELATSLLGKVTDDNDEAVSGWLSRQGVALEDGDAEDEEAESISVSQRPSAANKTSKRSTHASPRDSAIGSSQNMTGELTLHGSSPLSGKKRSAPSAPTANAKKRKANQDDNTIAVAAGLNDDEDSIAVAESKGTNAPAFAANKTRTAKSKPLEAEHSTNGHIEEPEPADEIKVEARTSRTSRKRKMEAEGEGNVHTSSDSRQTKQAKKSAEAANEESTVGRRTRSSRTKTGR